MNVYAFSDTEFRRMCLDPGLLADGTEIACRKCWQCLERKIDDWVGRCIAENKTAKASHFITLTYGRDDEDNKDHLKAAWLTYSDVQKYFKLLRRHGYKFRYIVTGEYGGLKGRCHWHLLMFWETDPPPHKLSIYKVRNLRFNDDYWPHGHQVWMKVNTAAIRYVCKYINKHQGDDESQGHLAMSKKPPLGFAYFKSLAMNYVNMGLAPQDYKYRFPDVKNRDGTPKEYHMSGTTRFNFLEQYKALWLCHQSGFHPYSEIIEAHDDAIARQNMEPLKERSRPTIYPPLGCGPIRDGKCPDDENRMRLYADDDNGRWWYVPNEEGYAWQREKIKGATENQSSPQVQENQYDKAKRGKDEARPKKARRMGR